MIKQFIFEDCYCNVRFIKAHIITEAINKYLYIHKEDLKTIIKIEKINE